MSSLDFRDVKNLSEPGKNYCLKTFGQEFLQEVWSIKNLDLNKYSEEFLIKIWQDKENFKKIRVEELANGVQEYIEICRDIINRYPAALKDVQVEYLPKENAKDIYAEFCGIAVMSKSPFNGVSQARYKYLQEKLPEPKMFYLKYDDGNGVHISDVNAEFLMSANSEIGLDGAEVYENICRKLLKLNRLSTYKLEPDYLPDRETYVSFCKEIFGKKLGIRFKYSSFCESLDIVSDDKNYKDLEYLRPEYFSKEEYANLISKLLSEEEDDAVIFKYVKPEFLEQEDYVKISKTAIENNYENIRYLKKELLPSYKKNKVETSQNIEENQNYTQFCYKKIQSYQPPFREKEIDELIQFFKDIKFEKLLPEENRTQIYIDLCKKGMDISGEILDCINLDYLPKENNREVYLQLCKYGLLNGDNRTAGHYFHGLAFVKLENLPIENNREIYADLCKEAVKEGGWSLQYVNFENLPEENNREIYLEICKNVVNKNDDGFKYINFENLPVENNREIYVQLCKEALNKEYSGDFKYVEFEKLPLLNNREIYADLCKIAVKQSSWPLQYVNFENLPLENNKEIYADLCKEAINKNNRALGFVRIELLPEQLQVTFQNLKDGNLGDDCLENAILNYNSSVNKGLGM